MTPDLLDYLRTALTAPEPLTPAYVEQALQNARHTYGGETVYIRNHDRVRPTRRTVQLRRERLA